MNRLSIRSCPRLPAPLCAILATALLTLSVGETAAVAAWYDPATEAAAFEQNFPVADGSSEPAPSTVELTDNQISTALFGDGRAAEPPARFEVFDPLQTP